MFGSNRNNLTPSEVRQLLTATGNDPDLMLASAGKTLQQSESDIESVQDEITDLLTQVESLRQSVEAKERDAATLGSALSKMQG